MDDVAINLSDKNTTMTLASAFGYNKTKVPFTFVQEHMDRPYLGRTFSKGKEVKTKEAETEETSVYHTN
jgi:hypothetical protein